MSTIGERISELRKSKSYSQEYVAERLNVSRQAVSKWEQDLSAPDTYNLIALAELLGVSVEYLATGKTKEPQETALEVSAPLPTKSGITVRQILGLILIPIGLLAAILGFVMEDAEILIIMAVYLIIIGILCVAVKKYFWMFFAWVLLVTTAPLVFMVLPVKPSTGTTGSSQITLGGIFAILFLGLFLLTAVLTVLKLIKNKRK